MIYLINRIRLTFIFIFIFNYTNAQISIIKKSIGKCEKSDLVALKLIKECALEKALNGALKKAKVTKEISDFYFERETKLKDTIKVEIIDILTSKSYGNIIDFSVPKFIIEENEVIAEIKNIKVLKYKTKLDESFSFVISNIKSNFKEGDFFKFKLEPNQNGYLNILIIDEKKVYKLFPNELEKENYLEAKKKYSFPLSQFVQYELEANSNEISNFYFIYTKKDIAFFDNGNYKDFLKKLYSLELNERAIEIKPITILK